MLVCLLIELNIKLTDGPAKSGAVQVRAIKGVAENQKSESAGSNTRCRWNVLVGYFKPSRRAHAQIPLHPGSLQRACEFDHKGQSAEERAKKQEFNVHANRRIRQASIA